MFYVPHAPSQCFEFIKNQKRCVNCFNMKHAGKDCTNSRACRQCSKCYHTLLHFDNSVKFVDIKQSSKSAPTNSENVTAVATHFLTKTVAPSFKILLATARVRVYSPHKRFVTVRALLDQGSVSVSNRLLNVYVFRELIAPFPVIGISEM